MTNGEPAILLLKEGLAGHHQWRLEKDEMVLGREPDCDIVLDDRQVSRRHARICRREDSYFLEDLQSKNGTFIGDQPVEEPTRLNDGEEITIALSVRLIFVGPDSTKPLILEKSVKALLPYIAVILLVTLIILFVPQLVTLLPSLT